VSRSVLDLDDLGRDGLLAVLELSERCPAPVLAGQGVALLFEKPSNRTRNATEMAVVQLGGHPIYVTDAEVGMGSRETPADVARTLACYHRVVAARVRRHEHLVEVAESLSGADTGVLNLLSDWSHPAQAVADLLTLKGLLSASGPATDLAGTQVAYVGDSNNVARSLAIGCAYLGIHLRIASPPGYQFSDSELARLNSLAVAGGITLCDDPIWAVQGASAVYTDVWTSMGQEAEQTARLASFAGYQVDEALMEQAGPGAVFMHCLPAHRGEEVTAEVMDGPRSVVWTQAANRLPAARGLLWWLVGGDQG
jgi:ornithine carbamoyltransferase